MRAPGGTSGCVETGAFGKEAYILTGYFNLPKVLEITLNNGVDPRTGKRIGIETGDPRAVQNLRGGVRGVPQAVAPFHRHQDARATTSSSGCTHSEMPAPFLSLLVEDCIAKGRDYNDGGPRYNSTYIMGVAPATCTDSLAAIRHHVFDRGRWRCAELLDALAANFEGHEKTRLLLWNRTPKYGNDDEYADTILRGRVRRLLRRGQRPAPTRRAAPTG